MELGYIAIIITIVLSLSWGLNYLLKRKSLNKNDVQKTIQITKVITELAGNVKKKTDTLSY